MSDSNLSNSSLSSAGDWVVMPALPLLMLGLFLPSCALEELEISLHSSPQPVALSCRALADHPTKGERHVSLSEAYPGQFAYIPGKEGWQAVHIAVGPARHGELPASDDIHVVVVSSEIHDESDLRNELGDGEIAGTLTDRGITPPPPMRDAYPNVDWKKCWRLRHNGKPTPVAQPIAQIAVGLAMLALGAIVAQIAGRMGVGLVVFMVLCFMSPFVAVLLGVNALLGKARPSLIVAAGAFVAAILLFAGGGSWMPSALEAPSGWPAFQAMLLLMAGAIALGVALFQAGYAFVWTPLERKVLSAESADQAALQLAADGAGGGAPAAVLPALGAGLAMLGLVPVVAVLLWASADPQSVSPAIAILGLGFGFVLFAGGAFLFLSPAKPASPRQEAEPN